MLGFPFFGCRERICTADLKGMSLAFYYLNYPALELRASAPTNH